MASTGTRAQSEVTGVALLTGVFAVVALIVGGFIIAGSGGGDAGPTTDVRVDATGEDVVLTHNGGDSVALSALRVRIARGSNSETTTPDATVGGGDDRFDPSERIRIDHGYATAGDLEVMVVHEPSGTILAEDVVTVP